VSEEDILQEGLKAFRSGDRTRAAAILAKLVQQHPQSERGWYLLGLCLPNAERCAYCFQRVLAVNPNNQDAKKQLALLSSPEPVPPPNPQPRPQPVPAPRKYEPETRHISPFVPVDDAPVMEEPLQVRSPVIEKPLPPKPAPQKRNLKKKISNRTLYLTIAAVAGVVCIFSLGVLYLFISFGLLPSPFAAATAIPPILPSPLAALETATPAPPTAIPSPMPTVVYTPRYEQAPCQFDTPTNTQVTCGYAIVPEDRTGDPADTIRLAVAVFHSTNPNPAPDPVVFLQGGPGGEAVKLSADAFGVLVAPFISTRDYIAFDQRGTGLSEPALNCDELDKVYRHDIYGNLDDSVRELAYQNAFLSCSGLLKAQGVKLSAFNTVESAADLKDIVTLLGYEKVNLYGISYGTRLALVTMRNHPQIVRSATLDSVVPVESNLILEYPNSARYSLGKLFETCKADADCNQAYPNLEADFWELTRKLDARPITLTTSAYPMGSVTETVDGSYLLSVATGLAKNSYLINTAPQTISRVGGGDLTTLIAAQYSLPYAFEGINPGLYISMMCREHILSTTAETLRTASEQVGVDNFIWRPYYSNFEKMFGACQSWGATGPVLGENDAVTSDIPTLVLEGAYDPATPPQFGKQVAERLPNSFYYEFPNQGHSVSTSDSSGCGMKVVQNFLGDPMAEPDHACLNDLKTVNFLVPYTGEPALELTERELFGVRVNIPKNWIFTFDGFFVRWNSPFDITQVSALRAALSVQDLQDYFSSSIHGYRGLDGAPVEAGTRQANGHTWKLYSATSNNRPVDIAAAEDGAAALIVIMFSHPDEHDALYRTVFLPMVDSAR